MKCGAKGARKHTENGALAGAEPLLRHLCGSTTYMASVSNWIMYFVCARVLRKVSMDAEDK